jgi:hypothetical protein
MKKLVKTSWFRKIWAQASSQRQKPGRKPCRLLAVGKAMPHCSAGNPDSPDPRCRWRGNKS